MCGERYLISYGRCIGSNEEEKWYLGKHPTYASIEKWM